MPLEHRGRGKGGRRVAGRKRAAFAGGPVPPYRLLDGQGEGLRQNLRAHQIEAKVRPLVRVCGAVLRIQRVAPDHVHADAHAELRESAQVFARGENARRRFVPDQPLVHSVIGRMRRERAERAHREEHPRGLAARKFLEVRNAAVPQRRKTGVLGLRRLLRLRALAARSARCAISASIDSTEEGAADAAMPVNGSAANETRIACENRGVDSSWMLPCCRASATPVAHATIYGDNAGGAKHTDSYSKMQASRRVGEAARTCVRQRQRAVRSLHGVNAA